MSAYYAMATHSQACSTSYATTDAPLNDMSIDRDILHLSSYSSYIQKPYVDQGSIVSAHPQDEGNHPPPLISRRLMPLPALAAVPIIVNPLLAYACNMPSIIFNLSASASAASLSPSAGHYTLAGPNFWRKQAATNPVNVGSMTIRLAGAEFSLWRPIVAFPESVDDSVVTIDDVLKAVNRAFRVAVLERQGNRNRNNTDDNQRRWRTLMPSSHLRNVVEDDKVWWAGLYSSPDERDVWILHTRMHSHI